jgi:predicted DNA-binding protein (UPF0251 family)
MSIKRGEKSRTIREKEALRAIKSRLKSVGPATPPPKEALLSLAYAHTGAGSSKPKKKLPTEFRELEIKEVESLRMVPWKEIPKWLQGQMDCRQEVSREATFDQMLKSLREKPSEKNLRLALMVLNEIGRFRDGSEFLMKRITQDLIDEFLARED